MEQEKDINFIKDKVIKRLEFVVSTTCNLNCSYCYANAGTYSLNTAQKIITKNVIKEVYELAKKLEIIKIEQISLFGGEPLLAIEQIEYICKLFSKFNGYTPIYTIVTNLTTLDEKFIQVAKKYNLHITVSLDGPKEINDIQRVFKNGQGTYQTVAKNIEKLMKENVNIDSIEATYTSYTEKAGYSQKEIAQSLFELFPNINCVQVCLESHDIGDLSKIGTIFFRNSLLSEDAMHRAIIKNKLRQEKCRKPKICSAGIGMISVFPNGNIYPCHLFAKLISEITNVFRGKDVILKEISDFQNKYLNWQKETFAQCSNCNITNLCTVCTALFWQKNTQNVSERYCKIFRESIKKLL